MAAAFEVGPDAGGGSGFGGALSRTSAPAESAEGRARWRCPSTPTIATSARWAVYNLIVGARSGDINLLLYSVFHLGNATNDVSWPFYERLAKHRQVAWAIPLSQGDSRRGFRVLGTNNNYYRQYRFGDDRNIEFAAGHAPADLYDTVIGAEVARTLGYKAGQQIVIAHGAGSTSFAEHADKPFTVVGVIAPTGTPIDRTVHVSLAAIQAIHLDWQSGMPAPEAQRVSKAMIRLIKPANAASDALPPRS